ncbi:MAG TPA: hypothetical protein VEA59_02750 [Patescibacteria group bacterium]|nr:hypothetical protein [Patescibacteria group bacterium]
MDLKKIKEVVQDSIPLLSYYSLLRLFLLELISCTHLKLLRTGQAYFPDLFFPCLGIT